MPPLLEVRSLRRRFGGLVAVNDASFDVTSGQIKALIGPNGAGKTTLFNLISGVIPPDAGRVTFEGRDITGWKPYQIAQAGVSRTFQNPSLFLKMSVIENVMVGRHRRSRAGMLGCALRLPGQRAEERALREAALSRLDYVGLAARADDSAGALAFGQRRMVELARALATEPTLLLLDEPASGLNTKEKEDLGKLILKIKASGVTIVLVEHDMSLVMEISDDIVVLHQGTPIAEGAPAAIQNNPKVIAIYLGEESQHAVAGEKS